MNDWTTFAAAEPHLSDRVRAVITSTTNCVLGTLTADGSPRLSGIDPFFFEDRLLLGSMPDSRKAADLRRDPRMALHAIPWESRKVKDGRPDPGEGDAKLTGLAHFLDDGSENQRIMDRYWADLGVESPGPGDLFIIEVRTATLVGVEDDELVIHHWSATAGRSTVRRT